MDAIEIERGHEFSVVASRTRAGQDGSIVSDTTPLFSSSTAVTLRVVSGTLSDRVVLVLSLSFYCLPEFTHINYLVWVEILQQRRLLTPECTCVQ